MPEKRTGPEHRAARYPKKSRGHPLRTVAERYAQIKAMSDKHSIKDMCATLGVSRSGYYPWKNAGQSTRAQQTNRIKTRIEKSM
jgi:hypothetical protein